PRLDCFLLALAAAGRHHKIASLALTGGSHERRTTVKRFLVLGLIALPLALTSAAGQDGRKDNSPPPGFTALFNGKDLSGWQALLEVADSDQKPAKGKKPRRIPAWLLKLDPAELPAKQKEVDAKILPHWKVEDGVIHYDGKGNSLQTVKHYGN